MPINEPEPIRPASANYALRAALRADDRQHIARIVAATGLFTAAEVDVAVELVDERNARGAASGYYFLLADDDAGQLAGYACFGPIACTQFSYDLYWIVVDSTHQGRGLGRLLLRQSEQRIAASGGRQVYAETSTRSDYAATRAFYERCGYRCESILRDFYAPADHRATYSRRITTGGGQP